VSRSGLQVALKTFINRTHVKKENDDFYNNFFRVVVGGDETRGEWEMEPSPKTSGMMANIQILLFPLTTRRRHR
jgi:hypothetical protein